jgi:hypothetical protein
MDGPVRIGLRLLEEARQENRVGLNASLAILGIVAEPCGWGKVFEGHNP